MSATCGNSNQNYNDYINIHSGIKAESQHLINSVTEEHLLYILRAKDFYTLILYPATLPNSLMNFSGFLLVLLGFSMYNSIMSSANPI